MSWVELESAVRFVLVGPPLNFVSVAFAGVSVSVLLMESAVRGWLREVQRCVECAGRLRRRPRRCLGVWIYGRNGVWRRARRRTRLESWAESEAGERRKPLFLHCCWWCDLVQIALEMRRSWIGWVKAGHADRSLCDAGVERVGGVR